MINNIEIGSRLKSLRENGRYQEELHMENLSREGLADLFNKCGYSSLNFQRIAKLEKAKATSGIKPIEIEAYCKVFGVSADYILFNKSMKSRPIDKLGLSGKSVEILKTWNTHEHKEGYFDHALDGLNAVLEYEYDYYNNALKNGHIEENPKKKTNRHHFPLFNDIWHFLHVPLDDVAKIHLTDGVILGRDAKPILESVIMRDISARLREISSWMNKSKK